MKKYVFISAVLVLAIGFMGMKLVNHNAKSLVKGNLIDNVSGKPVAFASITIRDSHRLINTIADEDGEFSLMNISKGYHYIQISKPGYRDTVLLVNIVHVKKQPVNIALNNDEVNNSRNIAQRLEIFTEPKFIFRSLSIIFPGF